MNAMAQVIIAEGRTDEKFINEHTEFVKGAAARGLLNVKGHRLVGGCRASIYNAQPIPAVRALVEFMKQYEVSSHV